MLTTKAKEAPRVLDSVRIEGAPRSTATRGGFQSVDGRPIDPEVIARNFGVTVEAARELLRRYSL